MCVYLNLHDFQQQFWCVHFIVNVILFFSTGQATGLSFRAPSITFCVMSLAMGGQCASSIYVIDVATPLCI